MTTKLEYSNAAPKIYWAILNRLLYNKKIPAILPLFVDGSFISDYCKTANLFFCFCMHADKKTIVYYLPFYIRPTPE